MKQSPLFHWLLILLCCSFLLGCKSCNRNKLTNLPKAITEVTTVDIPVSNINIPIFYEIKNFEEWINKKISGKFLETTFNPTSNKKDEILLVLNKVEPIRINTSGNQLICFFPLNITATLIKSRLGKGLTGKFEPMNAIVHIQLITPVGLDAGWDLVTKFKIKSIVWKKEPVIHFGPVKQNIKDRLNKWLDENEDKLTTILDKEMNKSVSLQPAISKIWNDLQKPLIIHKKDPKAWMKFNCKSIEGKIVVLPGTLACYASLKAKLSMMTDTSDLVQPTKLPSFQPLQNEEVSSDLHLYAFSSFQEINEEVNSLLKGKKFSAKGYSVSIKKIRAYASEAGLSVEVTTSGDLKGKMVASGRLEFDVPTQTMHIRNFEYALNSNSTMVNATEDFLHRTITDTIASKLTLKLDSLIHTVPPLVERAIARGKIGKVIDINFDHLYVRNCEIIMGPDLVHFKIHAGAEAGLQLKELKTGKKVNIQSRIVRKKAPTSK